jgi:fructoselysine-6-P-deglycase FrlB-like protein
MGFSVEDEVATQPDCWAQAFALAPSIAELLPRAGERVAFVGCGTSWFVAQVVAAWRETSGQGESDAFTASEVPDRPYDRVVAISRSGTTTEVVELLRGLRARIPTLAVTADLLTPIVAAADEAVDLHFADEKSVVQTRFATTTLALFRASLQLPTDGLVAQARAAVDVPLDPELIDAEQVTFLGRGWTIGLAHEAALKFRETSSSWAESYPAMDYRHGPIAVASPGRAVWMFGTSPAGLADEVRATGAVYRDTDHDPMADLIVAQRVAVSRAIRQGVNPDRPRHLTRSVVLSG